MRKIVKFEKIEFFRQMTMFVFNFSFYVLILTK